EKEQARRGLARGRLGTRLQPGHARHAYVEDRELDVLAERELDRVRSVRRFGDDLEIRLAFHHELQPSAHDRVVVRDEDARHERDRHQRVSAGTSSRTWTPPVRAGLIASAAPTRTARSRIPRNPPPLRARPFMPRPSSTTRSTTLSRPG